MRCEMRFMSLDPPRPDPQSLRAPLWLLVLVTLSGTMAMHIFVPALPVAGRALGASPASMQQTITLYVIGLAVGQIVYGPLSDALGRRPTLLIGLSLYFSAGLMALFSPTVGWLVIARLLQALGGAAGIALGRAIVRDTSDPARVTKDLALLNLLTLVGPGVAPILGGYLADNFGWRAVYVFLVAIGCAMLVLTYRLLPETHFERRPLAMRSIARDYLSLASNARFAGFTLGGACVSAALYPYLASVAYIVHEHLGLPIAHIGWFAASTIAGATLGNFLTRRLSGRWGLDSFLFIGAGLGLAMACALLLVHVLGWLTPTTLLVITVTMTFGAGLGSPAALASALSIAPGLTGSAAGFYGFSQMAVGAVGTMLVGYGKDPVLSCGVVQIGITALALCSFGFARSRR
jgi:DHA1 family bicyclomycin/chloramphenicol resistance-like MFS transporter